MNSITDIDLRGFVFQGGANTERIQHELFFNTLKKITDPDPVMIELGSNDCFYTIIFNKFFEQQKKLNICVEVSENLLNLGLSNVKRCNCEDVNFLHNHIGRVDQVYFNMIEQTQPTLWGELTKEGITVSEIKERYDIKKISVFHMDIQGSEIFALEEIIKKNIDVDYLFVSTHPNSSFGNTYPICKSLLAERAPVYFFDSEYEGGCGDGLIVCKLSK